MEQFSVIGRKNLGHILKRRVTKISECYQDGKYTDVKIICENQVYECHRLALAAASEYFHCMFGGDYIESQLEYVFLHDIDHVTFEQILCFVYRGEIETLDDNNVFNLLRASDILQLNDVEDLCVQYLTQKNIPMDCALEIYLYASASHKVALIPTVSRFILQHLDRFSQESGFLNMAFDDFGTLLTHYRPSTAIRDTRLLNAILGWVCHAADAHENRKLIFLELAQKMQFRSLSATLVAEYFDRNVVNSSDESRRSEVSVTLPDMDTIIMEMNDLSLHLYIGTDVWIGKDENYESISRQAVQTSIFSLREAENIGQNIDWHHSYTISPAITKMRIIESDSRLYSLKFHDERCTFTSCTTFNLCTNEQALTLPSTLISMTSPVLAETFSRRRPFSLCCLDGNIYLSGLPNVDFQHYNTELGNWSPIPALSAYERRTLVNDDARLYIIDRELFFNASSLFAAYDPRVGKVEQLNNEGLRRINRCIEPGCYHKGRIYLPDDEVSNRYFGRSRMAIYDTTAGRWDVREFKLQYTTQTSSGHRLVSYNNRLWMLGLLENSMYCLVYDSYSNEWNRIHCDKLNNELSRLNMDPVNIVDVLAFTTT